jgi:hypothetical protein
MGLDCLVPLSHICPSSKYLLSSSQSSFFSGPYLASGKLKISLGWQAQVSTFPKGTISKAFWITWLSLSVAQ